MICSCLAEQRDEQPQVCCDLKKEERTELAGLIRTGTWPARTQTRARILLLLDRSQGKKRTSQQVAESVMVSPSTVLNIGRRYVKEGLQSALYEKPRPGARPKLNGEIEAKLTMLACSKPPEGHSRWTLRLLASELIELELVDYVSHVTVGEWLKKTNSSLGE